MRVISREFREFIVVAIFFLVVAAIAFMVMFVTKVYADHVSVDRGLGCYPNENRNTSLENYTDSEGNRIEVVCVDVLPDAMGADDTATPVRFELLFHPYNDDDDDDESEEEEEDNEPVLIAFCPYLNGHNRWIITYDNDTGAFKSAYWRAYELPRPASQMEHNNTESFDVRSTEWFFDHERGKRIRIDSEGSLMALENITGFVRMHDFVPVEVRSQKVLDR